MKKEAFHILVIAEILLVTFIIILFLNFDGLITGYAIYQTVNEASVNDTYIRESTPTTNYGTASTLFVGNISAGTQYRSFIRDFNITSIGNTNTVTDAKLQVYVNAPAIDNITVKVYRVTSDWIESEATWNNKSAASIWTSSGGEYNSNELDSIIITNASAGYYNFSVTDAARGWVNSSYSNYGVIFIAPNTAAGNFISMDSTNGGNASTDPKFYIDYTANAIPNITNVSTDSSLTSPKEIGEQVNITVYWTDLESHSSKFFVCNSSSINISGCESTHLCNDTSQTISPSSCQYTVDASDNRTRIFYAAVCDSTNCSIVNQSNFFINHQPNVTVISPNGSETVNQSQGNFSVKFNVTDKDADFLNATLYYGTAQNSTTNVIIANLNLTQRCTDADSSTTTTNNCTYSWNSTGIYGAYFLTIKVDDTFSRGNDSSDASFNVRSSQDTEAPNITTQWINDSNIYSGETVTIYANVSDENINRVWVMINYSNYSSKINITMSNSSIQYNASWRAHSVGDYQFKVFANDTFGNVNNSAPWQNISVKRANATAQNETFAATALPYHSIRISGVLNATDAIRDAYANLIVPSGFLFVANYSQNTLIGNFTSGEAKTVTWFVSTPLNETNHTLLINYTDYYNNSFTSSTFQIKVTSDVGGGYLATVTGYPEVETSTKYFTEATFTKSGVVTAADSAFVSIYDAAGTLTVGPVSMNNPSTGSYNYSYNVSSSATEGQWETVVNLTKSSTSYYASHFWRVVGGPFDLRSISIVNAAVDALNISVIAENTGGANKDLILNWNLTRTDTNAVLDSGQDTFMVAANTERVWSVTPTTSYVGQVKITFLGSYSGSERIGAFKIFSTTAASGSGGVSSGGGGGGGGGGASLSPIPSQYDLQITADKTIYLARNEEKKISLGLKNTGLKTLTNFSFSIENLNPAYYTIIPSLTDLDTNIEKNIDIILNINDTFEELLINFVVKTNELTKKQSAAIIMLSYFEFILEEIKSLEKEIMDLYKDKPSKKNNINGCKTILNTVKENIHNELLIDAKDNLKKVRECIDNIKGEDDKAEEVPYKFDMMTIILIFIFLLLLVLTLIIAVVVYFVYRKLSIINYLKSKPGIKPEKLPEAEIRKDEFAERIKRIEDKLKE